MTGVRLLYVLAIANLVLLFADLATTSSAACSASRQAPGERHRTLALAIFLIGPRLLLRVGRRAHPAQVTWPPPGHSPGPPPAELTGGLGALTSSVRLEVLLPLLMLTTLYTLGWWRLSRRARRSQSRPAFMLVGVAALVAALLSPLDDLADRFFVAHMIQHMLLITWPPPRSCSPIPSRHALGAAPLVAATDRSSPHAALGHRPRVASRDRDAARVDGVRRRPLELAPPDRIRRRARPPLAPRRRARNILSVRPAVLVPSDPPGPHFRRAAMYPARVVYLVLNAFQTTALGLMITLAPRVLYQSYAGAGALEDQTWGGVVMWGLAATIDMLAVLILLYAALGSTSTPAPAARGGGAPPRKPPYSRRTCFRGGAPPSRR